MTIPDELQLRVQHRIAECIDIIEQRYHRRMPSPKVTYDVTGTDSAKANMRKWQLRLNPILLVQNSDRFIAETVPHEIAHFATDLFYPHVHRPGLNEKRQIHGRHWIEFMNLLGVPPNPHHVYDTTDVPVTKRRFRYQCSLCHITIPLGPKRHATLQKSPNAYHCRCSDKSILTFLEPIEPQDLEQSAAESKFNRCKAIYLRTKDKIDRSAMIDRFVFEVACSRGTASTYYAKLSKE